MVVRSALVAQDVLRLPPAAVAAVVAVAAIVVAAVVAVAAVVVATVVAVVAVVAVAVAVVLDDLVPPPYLHYTRQVPAPRRQETGCHHPAWRQEARSKHQTYYVQQHLVYGLWDYYFLS